jgi:hypothetical protein
VCALVNTLTSAALLALQVHLRILDQAMVEEWGEHIVVERTIAKTGQSTYK